MASISGFGNFGGIDPTQRFTGAKAPVPQRQAESTPEIAGDAVELRGAQAFEAPSAPAPKAAPAPQAEVRQQTVASTPERPRVPVTLSMEESSGISTIGLSSASPTKFDAFTNGIGSTSLTTLSGNIIAGARPFGAFN